MAGTSSPSISGPRDILEAKAYAALEHHFAQENVNALENTAFFRTLEEEDQHLDIGCGPGTFTKNYLVPLSRPCKRLVAIDKSPLMIDFAVLNSCHENITYDVFDFGGQSVEELLAKYGAFDRIYSFICFHYVKNQRKAYRDLAQLLIPGSGECLIVAAVSSSLTDAWRQMHVMDRWREFVPDPGFLFSDLFWFNLDKPLCEVESEIRAVVADSGLHCIDCEVYDSQLLFPNVETGLDMILQTFGFNERVPESDLQEFRDDWTRFLLQPGEGQPHSALKVTLYRVHARLLSP
ncbi:juvenile hormone acid O-methyltransferase-like [Haemaphysalis longicornis]